MQLLTYEIREYTPEFGSEDYISHGYYEKSDAELTLRTLQDEYDLLRAVTRKCKNSFHYRNPHGEQLRVVYIKYVPYE